MGADETHCSVGRGSSIVSRENRISRRVSDKVSLCVDNLWDEGSFQSSNATHYALQTINDHIESRLGKLQVNVTRLKRELWLLQRHVKEFHHPLFENWEADMLTRLIEVAYVKEYRKLPGGVVIGKETFFERENLTHAYSLAARDVRLSTVRKLGLSDRYHEALQRYPEVAPYRSPNPFRTETAFAKWLIEERENRPEIYGFWSKLFPVCYDRTVQQSASIF